LPQVRCELIVICVLICQSYDTKFLKIYPDLQPTPLQLEEDLEQLKVLENGYKMKVLSALYFMHSAACTAAILKFFSNGILTDFFFESYEYA
jgi:hypothetical protein